jgi:hypothetical protein
VKRLHPLLIATICLFIFSNIISVTNVKAGTLENTWQEMAAMPTARTRFGLTIADGKIYAIGVVPAVFWALMKCMTQHQILGQLNNQCQHRDLV